MPFFDFMKAKPEVEPPWNDNWKLEILHLKYPDITQEINWVVPHEYKLQMLSMTFELTPDGGISSSVTLLEVFDGQDQIYKFAGNTFTGVNQLIVSYMNWDAALPRSVTSEDQYAHLPREMYMRPGMRLYYTFSNPLPNHTINAMTLTFKRWNLRGTE